METAEIKTGQAFIRRGATVAKVTDQYGDERIIYRQRGMKDLRIKNTRSTKTLELNRIASQLMAERIREIRLKSGMTMEQLGRKAGMMGTPKERIYEIEKNTRKDGIRFGTLYALASALGVGVDDIMPSVQAVLERAAMTRLYAYKQYIKTQGSEGWHISFSENPPDAATFTGAMCLGVLELMHPTIVAAKDIRDATAMFEPEPDEVNG